jgi:acyl carrier protein
MTSVPLGTIKTTLRRLIEDNAGIPAECVLDESTVAGDLAMDSMSLISLQVAVEETFGITFSEDDLVSCADFGALAALVYARTETRGPADAAARRSAARAPRCGVSEGTGARRARRAPRTTTTP